MSQLSHETVLSVRHWNDTLFSFRTNKRIFESMIMLQHLHRWQATLRRITSRSRFELAPPEMDYYNRLCIAAAHDLLRHGGSAAVVVPLCER